VYIPTRSRARLHARSLRRGQEPLHHLSLKPRTLRLRDPRDDRARERGGGRARPFARLHAKKAEPAALSWVAQELELNRSVASRRVHSATDRGHLRDL
jgi:hypothetical protein